MSHVFHRSGCGSHTTCIQGAIVELQSEQLRRAAEDYRLKEEELRALAESGDLMAVRASFL
jgi:hypothetical protein